MYWQLLRIAAPVLLAKANTGADTAVNSVTSLSAGINMSAKDGWMGASTASSQSSHTN